MPHPEVGKRGRLVHDPKTKTGSGYAGEVVKVKDGEVHLKVDGGEGKYGPRIVKGSLSRFRTEAIKPKSKEDEGEYGYEGDMAMSQLRSIIRNSQAILDKLEPETDLPEWVQSKITLAKDYIETSANYLMSELEEERRTNDVARRFIGARQERERQRKRLGEPKLYEGVSRKAEKTAERIIGKKRKSLVNLEPVAGNNMGTGGPLTSSDASGSTGENNVKL